MMPDFGMDLSAITFATSGIGKAIIAAQTKRALIEQRNVEAKQQQINVFTEHFQRVFPTIMALQNTGDESWTEDSCSFTFCTLDFMLKHERGFWGLYLLETYGNERDIGAYREMEPETVNEYLLSTEEEVLIRIGEIVEYRRKMGLLEE